jgi:hypothetical protein
MAENIASDDFGRGVMDDAHAHGAWIGWRGD